MLFDKLSAPVTVQSVLRKIKDNRAQRKSYSYYSGYRDMELRAKGGILYVEASIDVAVEKISLLFADNIVLSAPLSISSDLDHGSADRFRVRASIDLNAVAVAWQSFCEHSGKKEIVSGDPSGQTADSVHARQDTAANNVTLREGTLRLAFQLRGRFDAMPGAIAWIQLEEAGRLHRRREISDMIRSGELPEDVEVIAHRVIGRFARTRLTELPMQETIDAGTAGVYLNKRAELAIGLNRPVRYKYRIRTDKTQFLSTLPKN